MSRAQRKQTRLAVWADMNAAWREYCATRSPGALRRTRDLQVAWSIINKGT